MVWTFFDLAQPLIFFRAGTAKRSICFLFIRSPEAVGSALVVALAVVTLVAALLGWRGHWDPKSQRFALQMLLTAVAVVLASPHSHLHVVALLLPPLALVLARNDPGRPLASVWQIMLAAGFLLTWLGWIASDLRWLTGVYFILALMMLLMMLLGRLGFGAEKRLPT